MGIFDLFRSEESIARKDAEEFLSAVDIFQRKMTDSNSFEQFVYGNQWICKNIRVVGTEDLTFHIKLCSMMWKVYFFSDSMSVSIEMLGFGEQIPEEFDYLCMKSYGGLKIHISQGALPTFMFLKKAPNHIPSEKIIGLANYLNSTGKHSMSIER